MAQLTFGTQVLWRGVEGDPWQLGRWIQHPGGDTHQSTVVWDGSGWKSVGRVATQALQVLGKPQWDGAWEAVAGRFEPQGTS